MNTDSIHSYYYTLKCANIKNKIEIFKIFFPYFSLYCKINMFHVKQKQCVAKK